MLWSELFGSEQEPSENQIVEFVDTALWDDLANHMQRAYNVPPKRFYSRCSMDEGFWKGWNIKYKKSSKSLCTLYPKQGHFVALINIGEKEIAEADLLILLCDKYTQELYKQTKSGKNSKTLAMNVTNSNILCDVKKLIELRASIK